MLKKLNEYMDFEQSGIFSNFVNPIWCDDFTNTAELDMYFLSRYGERYGFYTIMRFYVDPITGKVSNDKMPLLSQMLYNINGKKWEHLYKVFKSEYNPIENTDFIEQVTEDTDRENTSQVSNTNSTTDSGSSSSTENKYGFNSSNPVGDRTNTAQSSDTVSSTGSSSGSGTDNENKVIERRKHGNIGVTENVTMLEHESDFWGKWSFIDKICEDICEIIALSIY